MLTFNKNNLSLNLQLSQEAHCRFEPEQALTGTERHTSVHRRGAVNKVLEMRSFSPDSQIVLPFMSFQTDMLKSTYPGFFFNVNINEEPSRNVAN